MQKYKEKDREYHDIIGREYHRIVVEPREFLNSLLFMDIDQSVASGEKMLDVGCGTGHMLIRFGERFSSLVGVDHSRAMLDDAKKNIAEAGLQAVLIQDEVVRFLQLQALESQFDLITCTGFLHHLNPGEFQLVLTNIRRLLGSTGKLIIAEPIEFELSDLPEEISAWNQKSVARNLTYTVAAEDPDEAPISRDYLLECLAAVGLKVETEARAWELFPKNQPPSVEDKAEIERLHKQYGASGNVFAALIGLG